ncbi:ABC transporter ATP-binding protein [Kiloniella sp. b19]|uniref:ABC transporter ATP-binding protein n=1 Tax=Kiloniella sp. GXU_MW_B19 TaxID=3141326 RepID=UPI0031CDD5DC
MLSIEFRNVTRRFGEQAALDQVSYGIPRGKRIVLIGGSGSGKTLLLKCLLGIESHDGGEILVDGQAVSALAFGEHKRLMKRFGMQFQQSALFDSMTVWENIAFRTLQDQKASRSKARDDAMAFLLRVGLPETTADLYPGDLSGGMQKRVGLARAAFEDPDFLILDEPTAGLDPIMSSSIAGLINSLSEPERVTTVSVCSDLQTIRRIADQVMMLDRGKLVWSGPIEELDTTDNPYVRQFVSKSADGPIPTLTE